MKYKLTLLCLILLQENKIKEKKVTLRWPFLIYIIFISWNIQQILRLHFTNSPFFLTLYLCFQSCLMHLSWSYTCISTFLHCRGAMSSTCNPPSFATSLDTFDCMPPSCAHFHELLLQPFQMCWCRCQDRGNLCPVVLNILYLDNLWICVVLFC